jgi:GPH family glycoside/pentoside/hexuronide:cation symporter
MDAPKQQAATKLTQYLPPWLLAVFASAYIPFASLSLPLSVYLPHYYASHLGVSLGLVAGAFGIVRLIDIFLDSVLGIAISATRTPFGRFRPWMMLGIPLVTLATYAIFMARPGITELYMVGWLLLLYAGFSVLSLGQASWAAALVPYYHHRSQIYGWMQAAGIIGTVVVLSLPPIVASVWHQGQAAGVQAMGWFVIVITPLTVGLCILFVREPERAETAERIKWRDYWVLIARPSLLRILAADLALALGPAITAVLYLFFFTQVLGFTLTQTNLLLLLYILAGLAGAPSWWLIARKLGKHRTVMLACVLYGLAQAVVFVMPRANLTLMIPAMFFAGFVVSAFTFLIRAMIADVGDEVRLDIGKDRTALLYGFVTSTSKVGSALAVIVTFSILARFGFNAKEGAINTSVALSALRACYVFVPVLTMFVGAFMFRGYKLDSHRHDDIRTQLDARDYAVGGAEGVAESVSGTVPGYSPMPAARANPAE